MSLIFNMLSRIVKAFLARSNHLLISWLQSPSAVILEPRKWSFSLFPLFPHLFAIKRWNCEIISLQFPHNLNETWQLCPRNGPPFMTLVRLGCLGLHVLKLPFRNLSSKTKNTPSEALLNGGKGMEVEWLCFQHTRSLFLWDVPGGPVVRNFILPLQWAGFDPWSWR